MHSIWLLTLLAARGDGFRVNRKNAYTTASGTIAAKTSMIDCPDNVAYHEKEDVCIDKKTDEKVCMGKCEECCKKNTVTLIDCPDNVAYDEKADVCTDGKTYKTLCMGKCEDCCAKPTPAPPTPVAPTPYPTYEDGTIECPKDAYDDPKAGVCFDKATHRSICEASCDHCCNKPTPKPTPQKAQYPKGFCAGPRTFWTCSAGDVTDETTYGQVCKSSGGPAHGSKGQQWCADRCARGQTDNDNPDCPRGDCMCVRMTGKGNEDMEMVAPEKMPLIEGKNFAIPDSWCYQNMLQGDGWSWYFTWLCSITNGGALGEWTRLNKDLCGGDPDLWTDNLLTNTNGGAGNSDINKNCNMK